MDNLKNLLELYDDIKISSLLYGKMPLFHKFDEIQFKELHILAKKIAGELYNKYYNNSLSPEMNAKHLGIKEIISFEASGEKANCNIRACYCPDTKKILINYNSIIDSLNLLEKYKLGYFSFRQVRDFYILHELFHHVEEISNSLLDNLLSENFGFKSPQMTVRDIGAFEFTDTVTKTFSCRIIDLVWAWHNGILKKTKN